MTTFNHSKYQSFPILNMPNRKWPNKSITQAPQWCSVDLRDGNQALVEPMTVAQKRRYYQLLLAMGFKQIEVGFPAASKMDFDFVRWLIEENKIPDDVTIQVLTQARESLIEKTFEALKGVKQAIIHVYNSTSTVQRELVFQKDRQGIIDIAVQGATWVKQHADTNPGPCWQFEYSPESFSGTELDFAVDICDAVNAVWQPTPENPVIINLPATVEMSTPNVFADQVEWFCDHVQGREAITVSVHTHNDRGCAVAAAELAVMAGADRVEGTLLGNGERTGNMDIITMAMNLYSQGINPKLNLGDIDNIITTITECTKLPVHPRHPYVGELVYTAFSGSHQDAIKKCLDRRKPEDSWNVAYLPIDPTDLNRTLKHVIRVNSQSGKGGIAYLLEQEYGVQLPRWLQVEFSSVVQKKSEETASELMIPQIWQLFKSTYASSDDVYKLMEYNVSHGNIDKIQAQLKNAGELTAITGEGNGALTAFMQALKQHFNIEFDVVNFSEHALSKGADADAIAYLQVKTATQSVIGVAVNSDILTASLTALLNAVNQIEVIKNLTAA
ncbi:2-isopropylmalate synthase [Moritella viscosa]|uniref:2-isopropylmalate synthase n=2 Tax=Moritella viscosa TaxID=80854 RepID=A0ABY1HHY6_9GAMM|nr:2-isopropylmalate synthase [Moritella viscosa]SGY93602.1 Probable 2-isopropylmalate synthase [Moritella viscosa]SGZ04891.1 Probable 2-isopropylmalate synthase [Moritella viscosa]SHO26682.1 Probable 2-isopropylmalate synthase [Moritella viscosa]